MMRTSAFVEHDLSFRPEMKNGRRSFAVYPKGTRTFSISTYRQGQITQSSDGYSFVVESRIPSESLGFIWDTDSRRTWEGALELLLINLGKISPRPTWVEKVRNLRTTLGREPMLSELMEIANSHQMNLSELEEQRQSFARQDKD